MTIERYMMMTMSEFELFLVLRGSILKFYQKKANKK